MTQKVSERLLHNNSFVLRIGHYSHVECVTETALKNREECRFPIQKDREKEKARKEKAIPEKQELIEAEAKHQAELKNVTRGA